MTDEERGGSPPSDTPAADRLWDGMVVWMRGTFVVYAAAIATWGELLWNSARLARSKRCQWAISCG